MQTTYFQKPEDNGRDLVVKGMPNLVRRGGAIVSRDTEEYKNAVSRRAAILKNEKRLANLENKVEEMGSVLDKIYAILTGNKDEK